MKKLNLSLAVLLAAFSAFGQTNIQFTSVNATEENAILMHWTSTNHEVYAIQYADALGTNSDGSTTWNTLYDKYPSHGTNTFIGDFGNYDGTSTITHPKNSPMRFYRVVDRGADDDTMDTPTVTITSPTNGSALSGQISVSVSATCSNLPIVTSKLYVDGQLMDMSDDHATFTINTCEWPNGPHTIFAVATAQSAIPGPSGNVPISTSHGVSTYLPVTFSNLISKVAFTQPFFEPSLGQTQEITATFAANCDWTLQITDMDSNIVRNASGSGTSLVFDWDGTGDGETNIPDGNYVYVISVETNGESGGSMMSGSMASSSMSSGDDSSEWWAMPFDSSGGAVPLALYPPGIVDTNYYYLFQASPSEMRPQSSSSSFSMESSSSSSYSGPPSQNTTAPTRPPTSPMKNSVGTYGIAFFDWTNSQTVAIPKNGIPFPATGVCHLDGSSGTQVQFTTLEPTAEDMHLNFLRTMSKAGWKIIYDRPAILLHANDMRRGDQGGGDLFTTANIGFFLDHGDFGTDNDFSTGSSGSKQTYFRCSADSGDNGWLRMCQIGFGGDLKWMGLLACNSLNTYSSMVSKGAIPLKTTHMVCGCATTANFSEDFGALWAKKMLGGVFRSQEKVANAWLDAGHDQYQYATNVTGTIVFRVAGYPECMDDTIKDNVAPTSPSSAPGDLTKIDQQAYP